MKTKEYIRMQNTVLQLIKKHIYYHIVAFKMHTIRHFVTPMLHLIKLNSYLCQIRK